MTTRRPKTCGNRATIPIAPAYHYLSLIYLLRPASRQSLATPTCHTFTRYPGRMHYFDTATLFSFFFFPFRRTATIFLFFGVVLHGIIPFASTQANKTNNMSVFFSLSYRCDHDQSVRDTGITICYTAVDTLHTTPKRSPYTLHRREFTHELP